MNKTKQIAFLGHILSDHTLAKGHLIDAIEAEISPEVNAFPELYEVLVNLYNEGKAPKRSDVVAEASKIPAFAKTDVNSLITRCRDASHSISWPEVLHEARASQVRLNMLSFASDLVQAASREDLGDVASEFSTRYAKEVTFTPHVEDLSNAHLIQKVQDHLQAVKDNPKEKCFQFPIEGLRSAYGNMEPGMHLLGARPKQGKSSLALFIASAMCKSASPVGVIGLEMTTQQMIMRMLSSVMQAKTADLLQGEAIDSKFDNAQQTLEKMKAFPIHWSPTVMTISEIKTWVRMKRDHEGVRYFILDHIRRVKVDRPCKDEFERNNIISYEVSQMAKDLDVAICAICHIRRGSGDGNNWPSMSEIKGTGNFEEDAQTITVLGEPTPDMISDYSHSIGYQVAPAMNGQDLMAIEVIENRSGPSNQLAMCYYDGACNVWDEIK